MASIYLLKKKMQIESLREFLKVTANRWQNGDFIYFTNIIEHLLQASAWGTGKWISIILVLVMFIVERQNLKYK